MQNRPHKLGNVNPCGVATLFANGIPVSRCYDTPNARAWAFRMHPDATHATVQYPGFAPERIDRHDWRGSTLTAAQAGYVKI